LVLLNNSQGETMINYELAKSQNPKLKAALTRAQKKDYAAVLQACKSAVAAWEVWGAWPDNWSTWQRALDDAAYKHNHTGPREFIYPVRLEEL
jgi:hypothetical protein